MPSSIVVEAVSKLKENLFYLQSDGKFFFTNQPNLNRILLTKMEGIGNEELRVQEKNLLSANLKKNILAFSFSLKRLRIFQIQEN